VRAKKPKREREPYEDLLNDMQSRSGVGVLVIIILVIMLAFAAYFGYHYTNGSLSYTSGFQVFLYGVTSPTATMPSQYVYVSAFFTSDGPFSQFHSVELYQVYVTGGLWTAGTNASIVIGVGPPFVWQINKSEVQYVGSQGWHFETFREGNRNAPFVGSVNFTGNAVLWQGPSRLGTAYLSEVTTGRLSIAAPQAWQQYDSLRITTSLAAATLILAGVPTAFRTIRDLAWPTFHEWRRFSRRPPNL
jgi:hypothetical protein